MMHRQQPPDPALAFKGILIAVIPDNQEWLIWPN